MPQWTEETLAQLEKQLDMHGQGVYLDDVSGWNGPFPRQEDDLHAVLVDIGIPESALRAVATAVAPFVEEEEEAPAAQHNFASSLDCETEQPIPTDEANSADEADEARADPPLTFENVVKAVDAASAAASNVAAYSSDRIIAVVGGTGAGKSTFVHYVHGDTLGIDNQQVDLVEGNSRIGHDGSCTKDAEVRDVEGAKAKTVTVDLPGGFDTEGSVAQLRNGVMNSLVLTRAKHVAVVLVIPFDAITVNRGQTLMPILKDMERLLVDVPTAKERLRVVVSKVCDERHLDEYRAKSQQALVQEVSTKVKALLKQENGAQNELLKFISTGLERTLTLCRGRKKSYGTCMVFNPLDAAGRPELVNALMPPTNGLEKGAAFRSCLPTDVTHDVESMLREQHTQFIGDIERRSAPDLVAAAERLHGVGIVVPVMTQVGLLPHQRHLPKEMVDAVLKQLAEEQRAMLQALQGGDDQGVKGALERVELLTTTLGPAVHAVLPSVEWMDHSKALERCESVLVQNLDTVTVSVTGASAAAKEAAPSITVARALATESCITAVERFFSRVGEAIATALSAIKGETQPLKLAVTCNDVYQALATWPDEEIITKYCSTEEPRQVVIARTKEVIQHANEAAHDATLPQHERREPLECLNDFARCGELVGLVDGVVDVLGERAAVMDVMNECSTFTEESDPSDIIAATSCMGIVAAIQGVRIRLLQDMRAVLKKVVAGKFDTLLKTLDDNNGRRHETIGILKVTDASQSAFSVSPPCQSLQQPNPVADLLSLLPADKHLGIREVSATLNKCANCIGMALKQFTDAFNNNEPTPSGQASVLHLSAITDVQYTSLNPVDAQDLTDAVKKSIELIEDMVKHAKDRRDAFVAGCQKKLRNRLPEPGQEGEFIVDVRAFDETRATLAVFTEAKCDVTETSEHWKKASSSVMRKIVKALADPLSEAAAQTITGRVIPLLDTATFRELRLNEQVDNWAMSAIAAVDKVDRTWLSHLVLLRNQLHGTGASWRLCQDNTACGDLLRIVTEKISQLDQDTESRMQKIDDVASNPRRSSFARALSLVDGLAPGTDDSDHVKQCATEYVVQAASRLLQEVHAAVQTSRSPLIDSIRRDEQDHFDGLRDVIDKDARLECLRAEWKRVLSVVAEESEKAHVEVVAALKDCRGDICQSWDTWTCLQTLQGIVPRPLDEVACQELKAHHPPLQPSLDDIIDRANYFQRWTDCHEPRMQRCEGVKSWFSEEINGAIAKHASSFKVEDPHNRHVVRQRLNHLLGIIQGLPLRASTESVKETLKRLSNYEERITDAIADALNHFDFGAAVRELRGLAGESRDDAADRIARCVNGVLAQSKTALDVRRLSDFVSALGAALSNGLLLSETPRLKAAFDSAKGHIEKAHPEMESSADATFRRLQDVLCDMVPTSDTWRDFLQLAADCTELRLTSVAGQIKETVTTYIKKIKEEVAQLSDALQRRDRACINLSGVAKVLTCFFSSFPDDRIKELSPQTAMTTKRIKDNIILSLNNAGVQSVSDDLRAKLNGDVAEAMAHVEFWGAVDRHFGSDFRDQLPTASEMERTVIDWGEDRIRAAGEAYKANNADLRVFNLNYLMVSTCAETAKRQGLSTVAARIEDVLGPLRADFENSVKEEASDVQRRSDTGSVRAGLAALRRKAIDAPVLHACVTAAVHSVFQHLFSWSDFPTLIEELTGDANEDAVASALVSENEKFFRAAKCKEWNARQKAGGCSLKEIVSRFECEPPLDQGQLIDINGFMESLEKDLGVCFTKESTLEDVRRNAADRVQHAVSACQTDLTDNNLRKLLRSVCVALSAAMSESKNPQERLRLHGVQIVALLRILNIEQKQGWLASFKMKKSKRGLQDVLEAIPNHMAQVLTGEGKSFTLGVLAAVFALLGAHVDVVCYSRYLTQRDERALSSLFTLLCVTSLVHYATIDDLCRKHFKDIPKTAQHVLDAGVFPVQSPNATDQASLAGGPSVLLVDEVDVLFTRRFFGATFDAGFLLTGPEIRALIREVFEHRGKTYDVLDSHLFQTVVGRYPGTEDMLRVVAQQLVENSTRYNRRPASDFQWVGEQKKIGYRLKHGDEYDTGVVYPNMTQFAYLQLMEEHKISEEDAIAHIGLHLHCGHLSYTDIPVSKYQLLVGVTGTLKQASTAVSIPHGVEAGDWILTQEEKDYLSNDYLIKKFSFVPSMYGPSNSQFDGVNVWPTAREWAQKIETAIQHASTDGAALVFFKNRRMLKAFRELAGSFKNIEELTEEMPADTRQGYIANATQKTKVTAFTRAYVRGVDFPCRPGSLVTVIATYLPSAASEEVQMFGRTARQGARGAVTMILCEEHIRDKFALGDNEQLPPVVDGAARSRQATILRKLREKKMAKKAADRGKRLWAARAAETASRDGLRLVTEGHSPNDVRDFICRATVNTHRPAREAFVLVLDASGSMHNYHQTLIAATTGVQQQLQNQRRGNARFVVILFGTNAQVIQRETAANAGPLTLKNYGSTNYVDAFVKAGDELKSLHDHQVTLLFMTDGEPDSGFSASAHVGPMLERERGHLSSFHIVSFCPSAASSIPRALSEIQREVDAYKVPCVSSNAADRIALQECFAAVTTSTPMHL